MHLITADMVLDEVGVDNRNDFLLGAILPDAVVPKDKTHFFTYNETGETIEVNLNTFLDRYDKELNLHKDPLLLGYLCHLITDRMWLKDFYLSWIKEKISKDSSFVEAYHRDFKRLNGHLLRYNDNNALKQNVYAAQYQDQLPEITQHDVIELLLSMEQDFHISEESLKEPFEVFTYEQIIDYIYCSKSETLRILKSHALQGKEVGYGTSSKV